jgi:hypothetical protein
MHSIKRQFLLGSGLLWLVRPAFSQDVPRKAPVDKGPALEAPLVKEFVGVAHGKFEQTEQLLTQNPSLLNATWDWGGGDFETGLGGASHMGNKEIARFLIGKGARVDIFAAAMLNELEIVQAIVKAFPGIEKSLGPHKIPLIAHAKRGGAGDVVKYLENLPG